MDTDSVAASASAEAQQNQRSKSRKPASQRHAVPLFLGNRFVLTVELDREGNGFPLELGHISHLGGIVAGLARADRSVTFTQEHGGSDETMANATHEAIADANQLLSMLLAGIADAIAKGGDA